ncbi:hypothetical protein ACLOJK_010148 [Asimina triloba]
MAMDNYSRSSLDDLIRENALQALEGQRTGVLYNVPLPPNLTLSGIESKAVRLKSGSFWSRGANFSNVDIPPGCIAMPFATRIAIVYQLLSNSSATTYYNVPGYALATPVIGFFAYNASDVNGRVARNVGLMLTKDPISVRFLDFSPQGELNSFAKCARFGANGSMYLSEITLPFKSRPFLNCSPIDGTCTGAGASTGTGTISVSSHRNEEREQMDEREAGADGKKSRGRL